jgi:hypothetical protein
MGPKDLVSTPVSLEVEMPAYSQKNQYAVTKDSLGEFALMGQTTNTVPRDADND